MGKSVRNRLDKLADKYGVSQEYKEQKSNSAPVSDNVTERLETLKSKHSVKTNTANSAPATSKVQTKAVSIDNAYNTYGEDGNGGITRMQNYDNYNKAVSDYQNEVKRANVINLANTAANIKPKTYADQIVSVAKENEAKKENQAAIYSDIMAKRNNVSNIALGNNIIKKNQGVANSLPSEEVRNRIDSIIGNKTASISNSLPSGTDISKPITGNSSISDAGKRADLLTKKDSLTKSEIEELQTYISSVSKAVVNGKTDLIPEEDLLPNGIIQRANDRLKVEKLPIGNALTRNFLKGMGAESVAKAFDSVTGNKNSDIIQEQNQLSNIASNKEPAAAKIGQMAGSLALANAIGKVMPGANAIDLPTQVGRSAGTWGSVSAIKNLGNLASGEMSLGQYAGNIAAETAGGAVGTALSGALGKELAKTSLMNSRTGKAIVSGIRRGTYVAGTNVVKRAYQELGLEGEKVTLKDAAIDTLLAASLGVAEEGVKYLATDLKTGLNMNPTNSSRLQTMAESIPDDRKYYESDVQYEKAMNLKKTIIDAWNNAKDTPWVNAAGYTVDGKTISVTDGMKISAAADGINIGGLQYAIYRNAYDGWAGSETTENPVGAAGTDEKTVLPALPMNTKGQTVQTANEHVLSSAGNEVKNVGNAVDGNNVQENNVKQKENVQSIPETIKAGTDRTVKGLEKPSTIEQTHKEIQNQIIQKANPETDDINSWIRSVDDIGTFEEEIKDLATGPDFTEEDAQKVLSSGKVTVYSLKPIKNGTWVTPSKIEAQNYDGDGKIYSKTVSVNDVAWLKGSGANEGQLAVTNLANNLQTESKGISLESPKGLSETQIKNSIDYIKDTKIGNQKNTDLELFIPNINDENLDLPEQVKKYSYKIDGMHPVSIITGDRIDLSNDRLKAEHAKNILIKIKDGIVRSNFGRIMFTKKGLDKKIGYGASEADILAFDAIEDVIKKGIVISGHYNHDNRNIKTITIAAPITINGKTGTMAVVVKNVAIGNDRNNRENRYKIHRVLTPDGRVFKLDEAGPGLNGDSQNGRPSSTSSASVETNISRKEENSNKLRLANPRGGNYGEQSERGDREREGSRRDLSLSTGEQDGTIQEESGRTGKEWKVSGTPKESESRSLRVFEEKEATEVTKSAAPGQKVYIPKGKTTSMKIADQMANKAGVKNIVHIASDSQIEMIDGKDARGGYIPETDTIWDRINDDTATSDQLTAHEIAERAFVLKKVKVTEAIEKLKDTFGNLNPFIRIYGGFDPTDESISLDERGLKTEEALKEMICDAAAGINQFEGLEGYEDLSEMMYDAISEMAPWMDEKLLGALTQVYTDTMINGDKNSFDSDDVIPNITDKEQNSTDLRSKLALMHPDDIINAEKKRREDMDAFRIEHPKTSAEQKRTEPKLAVKDLKKDVRRIFSIPKNGTGEINSRIEEIGNQMLKNGKVTSEDRDNLLDLLYQSGSVAVDVETTAKAVRDMLIGRSVYVPEYVRQEYGEDWNAFRRKMFANKIYLTTDKSKTNVSKLAEELNEVAGQLFAEDDDVLALQEMAYYAEEGKPKYMNLYDEAFMQDKMYGEGSGKEYLDDLAKNLDKTLEGFAYKAGIEVDIRERVNKEISDRIEKQDISAKNKQTMRDIKRLRKRMGMNDTRLEEAMSKLSPEDRLVAELTIKNISTSAQRLTKKAMEKMKLTKELYEAKLEEDPNYIPDKPTLDLLQEMDRDYLKNKTLEELSDIHRSITTLMTHLTDIEKEIGEKRHETFEQLYNSSRAEINSSKGRKKPGGKISAAGQKFIDEEQLTPQNYVEMISGWNPDSEFYKAVGKQLEEGEREKKKIIVEMTDMIKEFKEKNQEWVAKSDGQGKDAEWIKLEFPSLIDYDEQHNPIFGENKTVYVTPSMMVELARGARNDDNLRHAEGGVTFPDKDLYSKGLRKQAYAQGKTIKIAPETMKMTFRYENLDEKGKELFDLMDKVFDEYSKEKINATSQIMDGVDRAMTKHYSKIFTNKNYRVSDMTVDESIGGIGSLKSRVTSKNPMYAMGIWDAFEDNMDTVSKYAGMAIPVRNVQSLLNWKQNGDSMKNTIAQKWGDAAEGYLENLVKRLSNKHYDEKSGLEEFGDAVLSNYISATFGFNPGIVLKQFSSFPSAAAVLGFDTVPSIKQMNSVDPELIKKYTPELAYRSMGWSTAELAELKNNPNWTQKNKVTRFIFGGAIQAMDYFTVKSMWPWAENYVKKNYPTFAAGSDAFYKKVAEVFNDAVAETQPMYDEMHRANIMKHGSAATRAFTLFKTVPMQQQNMIRKSYGEWKNAQGTENKARAGKAFAATIISLFLANVMFEGIEYLNQLWKNKAKYYRDEEGNLTAQSIGTEMAKGVAEDFIGTVIGGDQAVDAFKYITGDKWKFEIDTPGIDQVADLITTIADFTKETQKVVSEVADIKKNNGSVKRYVRENGEELLGTIKDMASEVTLYMTGASVSNIEKYIIGSLDWISPELAEEYAILWEETNKRDLKGLSDEELRVRVEDLTTKRFEILDESIDELCRLYKATETDAIPADVPSKLTINGEEVQLSASQKQKFNVAYHEVADGSLESLFESKEYRAMSDQKKADSLQRLYNLSREVAKNELGQEEETAVTNWKAAKEAGMNAGEYIAVTSAMTNAETAEDARNVIKEADITGDQKLAIYSNVSLGKDDAQKAVIAKLKSEDAGEVFNTMYSIKAAEDKAGKIKAVAESNLSTDGKKEVYYDLLVGSGETKQDSINEEKTLVKTGEDAGIVFDEYLIHKSNISSIKGEKDSSGKTTKSKQDKVVEYIKKQDKSKWKALWQIAGYSMNTYESKLQKTSAIVTTEKPDFNEDFADFMDKTFESDLSDNEKAGNTVKQIDKLVKAEEFSMADVDYMYENYNMKDNPQLFKMLLTYAYTKLPEEQKKLSTNEFIDMYFENTQKHISERNGQTGKYQNGVYYGQKQKATGMKTGRNLDLAKP